MKNILTEHEKVFISKWLTISNHYNSHQYRVYLSFIIGYVGVLFPVIYANAKIDWFVYLMSTIFTLDGMAVFFILIHGMDKDILGNNNFRNINMFYMKIMNFNMVQTLLFGGIFIAKSVFFFILMQESKLFVLVSSFFIFSFIVYLQKKKRCKAYYNSIVRKILKYSERT